MGNAAWKKKNKISCSTCDCDWGIEAEWKGKRSFPLIKPVGFKITDPSNSDFVHLPKKWKDACFLPQSIELDEIDDADALHSKDIPE